MLEAAKFYESKLPGLGSAFLAEVQRLIQVVLDQPQIGQEIARRRFVTIRYEKYGLESIRGSPLLCNAVVHNAKT